MRLIFTGLVDEIDFYWAYEPHSFLLGWLMRLIFTGLVDEIDFNWAC